MISYKNHIKKLALLLSTSCKKEILYKVLVLDDQKKKSDQIELFVNDKGKTNEKTDESTDDWYKMLSFATQDIFQPSGVGGHSVLDIQSTDILDITLKTIKLDTDLIIKDWEKRQIPRFRDDPPGQTCHQAIQELTKITNSDSDVQFLTTADFHIRDIDLIQQINHLQDLKKNLDLHINYTKIANFKEQFGVVYKKKNLEEKVENLKFMISHRSLALYPEYLSRIEVLKQLGYINEQNNGN